MGVYVQLATCTEEAEASAIAGHAAHAQAMDGQALGQEVGTRKSLTGASLSKPHINMVLLYHIQGVSERSKLTPWSYILVCVYASRIAP